MIETEEVMDFRVTVTVHNVNALMMNRMREIIFAHDLSGIKKVALLFKMFNAISTVVVDGRKQSSKLSPLSCTGRCGWAPRSCLPKRSG
jgi:hypothetical protein